jgi:hypothetical protein
MGTQKTHFEQVPLEMVRKMIAEQSRREEFSRQKPATSGAAVKTTPTSEQDKTSEKSKALPSLDLWTLW